MYNNRAQTLQLKGDLEGALKDLDEAIRLAESIHDEVSLKQSYTQRGIIKKRQDDEEGARADFEKGAQYGSTFAAKEAAALNPMAKLCNQMVSQAMKSLQQS